MSAPGKVCGPTAAAVINRMAAENAALTARVAELEKALEKSTQATARYYSRLTTTEAALEDIHAQAINALELGAKGKGFFEDVRDAARAALKDAP